MLNKKTNPTTKFMTSNHDVHGSTELEEMKVQLLFKGQHSRTHYHDECVGFLFDSF